MAAQQIEVADQVAVVPLTVAARLAAEVRPEAAQAFEADLWAAAVEVQPAVAALLEVALAALAGPVHFQTLQTALVELAVLVHPWAAQVLREP